MGLPVSEMESLDSECPPIFRPIAGMKQGAEIAGPDAAVGCNLFDISDGSDDAMNVRVP